MTPLPCRWRIAVAFTLGLIVAMACLPYTPEHKVEPVALWSHRWLGPHYLRGRELLKSAVWRIPR
jgi:hypothetical protein